MARSSWKRGSGQVTRAIIAIVVALIVGGIILLLLGRNPLAFYADIFRAGVLNGGWQDSITRMSVLLLMGMGYVVAFRGGIWNIGGDGQFLLSAALIAGVGPALFAVMPHGLGAHHPEPRRHRGRGFVDDRTLVPAGLLRAERDHHVR